MEFHVECTTNRFWGSLGARDMNTFARITLLLIEIAWAITIFDKSVKNCVEWCSKNTQNDPFRFALGVFYDIIILYSSNTITL